MVAVTLYETVGLPREALIKHVKISQGLPHRVEKVNEKSGMVFTDDSRSVSVGVTVTAIVGLQNPSSAILDGMSKGQDLTPLRNALADKVKGVFLIDVDAPQIR